ncbi:hypothetical protein LZ023_23105 [Pseudomonas silvicola]|nr:hypothetical protein LZ023_23105 [Pseudomonas silvicola]
MILGFLTTASLSPMPKSIITTSQVQEALAKLTRVVDNKAFYAALNAANRLTDIAENAGCALKSGYRLIRIDDRNNAPDVNFEIALIDDIELSIVYYSMIFSTILNGRPTAQIWTWRSYKTNHWEELKAVISKASFNYIIKRFDILISNDLEVGSGEFFWLRQISNSIAEGYSVYYYKGLSTELQPISSQAEFYHFVDQCWSGSHDQHQCLALISRSPLFPPLLEER